MRRILSIIMFLCCIYIAYGQRTCGSEINVSQLLQKDPVRYQRIMALENKIQAYLDDPIARSIPQTTIYIPVVVHVIYNNSTQNITDAQIHSQIQVLNEDFRRLNPDRINTPSTFANITGDANIQFRLAKIDPNGNSTNGIIRTLTSQTEFSKNNDPMKFAATGGHNAWNTQKYLNIWICKLSGDLLGYAQFPSDFAASPNTDGVVIDYRCFGRDGSAVYPYNKGRTATHEIGHWLNLRHIWGDDGNSGCHCSGSDEVSDTPNQSIAMGGCPSFPVTDCCTAGSPGIMFMNYMDYTDDACMNIFTNGQVARMRALFDTQTGVRKAILMDADYLSNPISGPASVCPGSTATYTVTNAPASYTWDKSSNLTLISSSGNSATFMVNGTGWVSIKIGDIEVARKNIQIPGTVSISGAASISVSSSGTYTASKTGTCLTGNNYQWWLREGNNGAGAILVAEGPSVTQLSVSATSGLVEKNNQLDIAKQPSFGKTYYLQACLNVGSNWVCSAELAISALGNANLVVLSRDAAPANTTDATASSYIYYYPNPTGDILNVEINEVYTKQKTVFDIRLYDGQGNLLRNNISKGEKTLFNVSNIPNGIYYLHVYDGSGNQPDKQQIIIKH